MEFKKKKYKYPKSIYVKRKEVGYSSEEQELDMYIDKIYKSKDEEYINRIREYVELVQDTKFNFTIRLWHLRGLIRLERKRKLQC